MLKPIIIVVGTRAEAIKLIPLYLSLKKSKIKTLLCATSQHSDLLEQVFKLFNVTPDFNLSVMKENQDLFYLTSTILEKTKQIYLEVNPQLVLVHGDTTTTMASALSAFYLNIPIGHVEAGLRTGNIRQPFPEEMNRKVVGQVSSLHFAPTAFSVANLLSEGVKRENVFCTGNTIVDSLVYIKNKIEKGSLKVSEEVEKVISGAIKNKNKIVLLTAHRRESFNGGLDRVFSSIKRFAALHKDVLIFLPLHPNPNVLRAAKNSEIGSLDNVYCSDAINYKDLVYVLMNSSWVATDSGGIQEEAVSLGKRVLVLRDITERWEGVWDGSEKLVGTNDKLIYSGMQEFYRMDDLSINASSVYGDGHACNRIVSIIKSRFNFKLDNKSEDEKGLVVKIASL